MVAAATSMIAGLTQGVAVADPKEPGRSPRPTSTTGLDSVALANRDEMLGKHWRQSQDRAWIIASDAKGFHILVADKKSGYAWKTAASLSEPGFDTDMWIGNACVTGSGRRAVVAYAPRSFTNKAELMARGAFTAVVDLDTGKVTKLNRQASLAYFSPGCGLGETAVFTQLGGETKNATRLIKVNAGNGRLAKPIMLKGEVTSAIPVGSAIVAADSARLIRIDEAGRRTALAATTQIPFLLKPDANGGVVYMDRSLAAGARTIQARDANPAQGVVKRITAQDIDRGRISRTKPAELAVGPLTQMDLSASAEGHVFITGNTRTTGALPSIVKQRTDVQTEMVFSTRGETLVANQGWADGKDPRSVAADGIRPAKVTIKALGTGKSVDFQVIPDKQGIARDIQGRELSPALPVPASAKKTPSKKPSVKAGALAASSSTVDDGRVCSVPRNDPAKQTMQPKPRQVEWAVDQAITGNLNKLISRPANWKNEGMAAYQPQTLFPLHTLTGGGRIPAQVMLGITAQESNMWQASRHVTPGETGNPLIGNYYGTAYAPDGQQTDPWAIDWSKADCGYGITQVTDGMRLAGHEKPGETALSTTQQQAVALDYTANIAAGVNILADKWNQTRADGLIINNGQPQYPENWFFALWAYNSGYYPKANAANTGGLWGVGFTNNPANPLWKANRLPFLENATGGDNYSDAAHPQDWPYPEKVLGWAARPLQALESPGTMVVGYRAAWWTNNAARTGVKPPESLFCTTVNQCDPSKIGPNDSNQPGMGACTRNDLKCWWNQPTSWKNCAANLCGNEILRFDSTYPEQDDGTSYPPNCTTSGLPDNALIIDDVPDNAPIHRPGCTVPKASAGNLSFTYGPPPPSSDAGKENAKIDLHQVGSGYASHFWFTHQEGDDTAGRLMRIVGTWKLDGPLAEPLARVLVHIPDHGAQANVYYDIHTARGIRSVLVNQNGSSNRWVDLGVYGFKGVTPKISLSNHASIIAGDLDVAYDAVAFVPKPFQATAPVLHLPNPDPSAPEPEDVTDNEDPPQSMPSGLSGTLLNVTKGLSGRTCRAAGDGSDRQYCIKVGQSAPSASPNLRSTRAVPTADQTCGTYMVTLTRYFACESIPNMEFVLLEGGAEKTLGVFSSQWNIELNKSQTEFQLTFQMSMLSWDPSREAITFHPDFGCTGACTVKGITWDGPATWTLLNSGHKAKATVRYSWNNSGEQSPAEDILTLSVPTYFTDAAGGRSTSKTWATSHLGLRCDNKAGLYAGCAFSKFTPTWTLASKKYPTAAAMYWILMKKLSSHPGSAADNSPLHRIADKNKADANRAYVCDDGTFVPHPDASGGPISAREVPSCDEYPFAATKESAGYKQISGFNCVQFYATKKSGNWELGIDDGYDTPNWSSSCGRGAIPLDQNTGAGGGVGGIVSKYRILDDDPYFLATPGFGGCDINAPECTINIP